MKICFVTSGDISRVATMKRATGLAECLVDSNYEVSIIALDCQANKDRIQYECPRSRIYYFKSSSFFQESSIKKKYISEIHPDFVYVQSLSFRNWINKHNSYKNALYFVEHSELTSSIGGFSLLRRYVYRFLERFSHILYHGQVVASKYLYNHFAKYVEDTKRDSLLYFPYAYNKNIFNINEVLFASLGKRYEKYKVALYMGTLRENYGLMDIINAAELLKYNSVKIKIIILGSGAHKLEAIKLVKQKSLEEIVEFPGYVPEYELGSYFKIADVFISPLYDTTQDWARCPSKLYMYAAFNKPVVTSRIGEAIEIFPDNKFFFQPGSSVSMSNAIVSAVNVIKPYPAEISVQHEWCTRAKDLIAWIDSYS